ncbi:MAG TPA: hypothetical protein VHX37_10670 [Acidobacteriaceae bacterium]|jgi:hypothetical protein|nr:hypothetical protein [Acidobacteriaceae bacterium]
MPLRTVPRSAAFLAAATLLAVGSPCRAQDSGFQLDVHANSHATAQQIGLPVYPGARIYQDKDDSSADLGMVLNSFHFRIQVVSYTTSDRADRVLAICRKPLSHYGEVLECRKGKPAGALTRTRSGLTCSDRQGDHLDGNGSPNSSSDHELGAGEPNRFRMVGIDSSQGGSTRFGLVYLELPKEQ